MEAKDFDYRLPEHLIAQHALRRGQSRLMVVNRALGTITHQRFNQLAQWFDPGDCLVVNDSKVMPARFWAVKVETQAKIEFLLHQHIAPGEWTALAKPVRRLSPGTRLQAGPYEFSVKTIGQHGQVVLGFASARQSRQVLKQYGVLPLPPYIKRQVKAKRDEAAQDRRRYQTLFARHGGSVAAPTAGLHFSPGLTQRLQSQGIAISPVTLHVGWGTFAALPEGPLNEVKLHTEYFNISQETADHINACKHEGHKVVACGTTVTRTLEANSTAAGTITPGQGATNIFIKPGYHWKVVDHLITNFHLPKSSLLMLVAAFAGKELTMKAYQEAVNEGYRFFSYGDAMLIL